MMIHRPSVRARVFVSNLQTKSTRNRKFSGRNFMLYMKRCNWCKRPNYWSAFDYPGLCTGCARYLNGMDGLSVSVKMSVEYQDWSTDPDILL